MVLDLLSVGRYSVETSGMEYRCCERVEVQQYCNVAGERCLGAIDLLHFELVLFPVRYPDIRDIPDPCAEIAISALVLLLRSNPCLISHSVRH